MTEPNGALFIPYDIEEPIRVIPIDTDFITWDQMRGIIGCQTLEVVTLPQVELSLWIDEDGLMTAKPPNGRVGEIYFRGELIRGNALVTSYRTDSEGNPGVLNPHKLGTLRRNIS